MSELTINIGSLIGRIFLSLWSGINLLLAVGILTALTFFGKNAPALKILFDDAGIRALDPKALATINSLAVFGNGCAAAFCALVLVLTWGALRRKERWAFFAIAFTTIPLQTFGFVSDSFLGHRNLMANIVSSAILLIGLGLTGASVALRKA